MKRIRLLLFTLFLFQFSSALAGKTFLQVFTNLESVESDISWTNTESIITGDAYSGTHFCRTDSLHPYGFGYKGKFPGASAFKNLHIRLDAQVRMNGVNPNCMLVISIQRGDSTVYWESYPIREEKKIIPGSWFLNQQEFSIPSNLTDSSNTLAIYIWNSSKTSLVDLDDVSFLVEEKNLPSYLIPGIPKSTLSSSAFSKLYSGKYFSLGLDKLNGNLKIFGADNGILFDRFLLYADVKSGEKDEKSDLVFFTSQFKFLSDSSIDKSRVLNFEASNSYANTRIVFEFSENESSFAVRTSTVFIKGTFVNRIALLADFVPSLKEVYLPSSLSDTSGFQHEYWLGKCGFAAGEDESGFRIVSCRQLSSIQLDVDSQRCIFNLDYNLDHPLLHFPLSKRKLGVYEDYSSSYYQAGDTLFNSVTIYGNNAAACFPRIMKNPEGKTAAIIWTEHADYTDLITHRAVYFGADTIEISEGASGGFIKNKIPVTKSVFYANPDKVSNAVRTGFLKTESASMISTPGYTDFLKDLQKNGNEICLHTPDHYTSTRKLLQTSLEETSRLFNSTTWIDHGYDNALKSNREDLACDGLDSSSKFYSADLWKQYGLKYFWNSFYEDSGMFAPFHFFSFLTVPYSGWGGRFPMSDYWRHPTRSGDLIHWRTVNTVDLPDGSMWNFIFSETKLNDLVQTRGTYILHVYPARLDSTTGFYRRENNHFVIDPEFEKALERQAALRDQGKLNLTTIRDYLDYQVALEHVELIPLSGNSARIKNASGSDLKGLSCSIKSNEVKVEGKAYESYRQDGDLVFWFDLSKGESVVVTWK